MTQKKFSTKFLVEMALLVAIILIMAFTPLGYIKTVGIEITRICQFFTVFRTKRLWCDAAWN